MHPQPDRDLVDVLKRQGQGRIGPERRHAGQQVVERDAHRVEVAAVVEGMPLHLLGAHVERRADRDARSA